MSWEGRWSVETLSLTSNNLGALQHAQASEATSYIYIYIYTPKELLKKVNQFFCMLPHMIRWVVLDTTSYHLVGYIYIPKLTVESSLADIYIGPSSSDDQSSCPLFPSISYGEVSPICIDALSWLWSPSNDMLGCFYATPLVLMLCHDFDLRGERGMGRVRDDGSWEGGELGDGEGARVEVGVITTTH